MEQFFHTREEASIAAAECIATALSRRLESDRSASLVVTGGSSPQSCYESLAAYELPWEHIHVVLSDERWVPPSCDDSNERMIRDTLLVKNASNAQLHPFYEIDVDVAQRCSRFADELHDLPSPFASCLLGMGEDGHVASLFADAKNFANGIDANSDQLCIPVQTSASPHMRISLTMSALMKSDEIVLLFFGDAKLALYEQAKLDATKYPVSRILHQNRVPVSVFWAS